MQSNFLNVPFLSAENSGFRESLTQLIKDEFFQPVSALESDISRGERLHTAIVSGSRDPNVNAERYQNALAEFYYYIKDIQHKCPQKAMTFEWFGNLRYKPVHHQVEDWNMELYHLVFQMGCTHSLSAHQCNTHSEEGVKTACRHFKLAAGCFEFLLQVPRIPCVDFDHATLNALKYLMLGQAQELVWQRATVTSTMKNTLIARLSVKVAEFYDQALEHANASDSIILEWINHLKVKSAHFKGAAFYRMSLSALDDFEYGVQVARLQQASKCCKEGQKYKKYVNQFVLEDLSGLSTMVEETLKSATKDNDLVYLKPVPSAGDLPAIVGAAMVDHETPEILVSRDPEFPEAFSQSLPFTIVNIAQAFSERQDTYIQRTFQEPYQALNTMLHKFLAERDLPASIDAIQKPENLPDSIVHHSKEIISIGGINIIERSMDEIANLAAKCRELVHECDERLRMEKEEDTLMREREGSTRWTREKSEVAGGSFVSRVQRMRDFLSQGSKSDALLGNYYKSIRPILEIYCAGEKSLLAEIPSSGHVKVDPEMSKQMSELRDLMLECKRLETAREKSVSALKVKAIRADILPIIVDAYKRDIKKYLDADGSIESSKFEHIYEQHIERYKGDVEAFEESKDKQIALEKRISEANSRFVYMKDDRSDEIESDRHRALQNLEEVYVKYLELIANLNQASKFYSDFLEKGNHVLHELDEYLYNRREEARELVVGIRNQENLDGIEQSMSRTNLAAPKGRRPDQWDGRY